MNGIRVDEDNEYYPGYKLLILQFNVNLYFILTLFIETCLCFRVQTDSLQILGQAW